MKLRALRIFLVLDAAILFLLGVLLIVVPERVETLSGFSGLGPSVNYILSLWGCALATLAFGYCVASTDPVRHVIWVQVGIARGALELLVGWVCVARGTVTWSQARFGIIVAGLLALTYLILYPRLPRPVVAPAPLAATPPAPGLPGK